MTTVLTSNKTTLFKGNQTDSHDNQNDRNYLKAQGVDSEAVVVYNKIQNDQHITIQVPNSINEKSEQVSGNEVSRLKSSGGGSQLQNSASMSTPKANYMSVKNKVKDALGGMQSKQSMAKAKFRESSTQDEQVVQGTADDDVEEEEEEESTQALASKYIPTMKFKSLKELASSTQKSQDAGKEAQSQDKGNEVEEDEEDEEDTQSKALSSKYVPTMKFKSIKALISKAQSNGQGNSKNIQIEGVLKSEDEVDDEEAPQSLASKYIPTMKFKSIKALIQQAKQPQQIQNEGQMQANEGLEEDNEEDELEDSQSIASKYIPTMKFKSLKDIARQAQEPEQQVNAHKQKDKVLQFQDESKLDIDVKKQQDNQNAKNKRSAVAFQDDDLLQNQEVVIQGLSKDIILAKGKNSKTQIKFQEDKDLQKPQVNKDSKTFPQGGPAKYSSAMKAQSPSSIVNSANYPMLIDEAPTQAKRQGIKFKDEDQMTQINDKGHSTIQNNIEQDLEYDELEDEEESQVLASKYIPTMKFVSLKGLADQALQEQ